MFGIKSGSFKRVVLAFIVFVACNDKTSSNAIPLDCPVNHDEPVPVLLDNQGGTAGVVEFNIHTQGLCTLTRVTTLDGHEPFLTPVARSYSGYQWEGQNPLNLKFDCDTSSGICSTQLPLIDPQTEQYHLTSFEHSLTTEQATARLLLQTTFGPTKETIANYGFASPAEFVKDQMEIPMTEHRAFYRRNTQAETHAAYGVGRPHHPCEKNSRWRKHAMSGEDVHQYLEVSVEGPPYVLSVNGAPRTQVVDLGTRLYPGYKVKMGWGPAGMVPNGNLVFWNSTEDDAFSNSSATLIQLDPSQIEPIGNGDSEIIHKISVDDTTHCSAIPLTGKTDVFAYVNGIWYIHDPILVLRDNTPTNMEEDGGVKSAPTSLCASAPRTSFNEKYCFLSKDPDSCKDIICPGTSGEVSNNPFSHLSLDMVRDAALDTTGNGNLHDFEYQKWTIWVHTALNSQDQLRQRVAWALYQILVLAADQFDTWTEHHLVFYDIFVRNAFGNFRDVLKEVSFSPMMALSLSFLESKSRPYIYETTGKFVYPDENYAREIMQLFTIGLFKLNKDGTNVQDQNGDPIPTYNTDDIMEMARAWTGFVPQGGRGNIELARASNNRIDYLSINGRYRDPFPKMDLNGGYIGDGLPLCVDNPDQPFLRAGATYRLLGSSHKPELFTTFKYWRKSEDEKVVELETTDALYEILCNAGSAGGECNFQTEVTLTSSASSSSTSTMIESVDTVRVVKVNANTYYEYVPDPCVYLPFYNDGKKVIYGPNADKSKCIHPSSLAADGCCRPGTGYAFPHCTYSEETIKFETHKERCTASGYVPCDINRYRPDYSTCSVYFDRWHWTDKGCSIEAKVDNDGKVSIVHAPETPEAPVHKRYNRSAKNFFRVKWTDGNFPSPANDCGAGACTLLDDGCLCQTAEESFPILDVNIFDQYLSSPPSNLDDIVANLHIGAVNPTTEDSQEYSVSDIWSDEKYDIRIWISTISDNVEDRIIEVTQKRTSRTTFFQNRKSVVKIVGSVTGESEFEFRNPPMFGTDHRDALYETEKVLDHFFFHENTPTFLSIRFIQRFGVSNPTPGYVERVASAFQSGVYSDSGVTFGSGKYGDLESTIAAVILDRESRSAVLDADPSSGSLREPLLKTMHFFRSMDYRPNGDFPIFYTMQQQIGQMAHGQDTVFSFFLPDYAPPGVISSSDLVAPEALLMNTPYVVGLMKGLFSLVKWGLTNCDGGFGNSRPGHCYTYSEGDYYGTQGQLYYSPPSSDTAEMISELDLLLTGGRLNNEARALIESALQDTQDIDDAQKLRLLMQIMVGTPEFHTTNSLIKLNSEGIRAPPEAPETPSEPYKAIIYVMLSGGADSFNMLVPHSECTSHDMYEEYNATRGSVALRKDQLLPIDAGTNQPCAVFGLHPTLTSMQKLYNSSDAAFFANTGVLHKPSTRENYRANHKKTGLFGHGIQRAVQVVNFESDVYNTGVLGRIADALYSKGLKTSKISTGTSGASGPASLVSEPLKSPSTSYVSPNIGPTPFDPTPSISNMREILRGLNNATKLSSSLFGESWSSQFLESLDDNDFFFEMLNSVRLDTAFPNSGLGNKLELVSKLIKAHEHRGIERDLFYVSFGKFDSHRDGSETIDRYFAEMDNAINSFSEEMKTQGLWDSVVLVTASDFGRTLTPNGGGGTDHAWGGNYLMVGGSVAGKKIHGFYPDTFNFSSPIIIGRGVIPTTGWDSVWNGISEWFGATNESELDHILPNRGNMAHLLTKDDMFIRTTSTPTEAPGPTESPTYEVSRAPAAGTFFSKSIDFANLRGNVGTKFSIGGVSINDQRVSVTKTNENLDVIYSISISGYDLDGGGKPDDSISFKIRLRAVYDVSIFMCKGFCAAANGGTPTQLKVHDIYFGVKDDTRIKARESVIFTVEDISLTAEPGFTAEFDGFTSMYVTEGSYIIGEGFQAEGRVAPTGRMHFDPIEKLRLTPMHSTERLRDVIGRFTVSGYILDSESPTVFPTRSPTPLPTRAPAVGTLFSKNVQFINLRGTVDTAFRIDGVSVRNSRVSVTRATENENTDNQEYVYSITLRWRDLDGGGQTNDSLSFKVRFRALKGVTYKRCDGFCATAFGGTPTEATADNAQFGADNRTTLVPGNSIIFTVEDISLTADPGFKAEFDGFKSMWTTAGHYVIGEGEGVALGRYMGSNTRMWFDPVQELRLSSSASTERVRDLIGSFTVYGYR